LINDLRPCEEEQKAKNGNRGGEVSDEKEGKKRW
jgi:hypothetical protein